MKSGWGAWGKCALVVCCLSLAAVPVIAQKKAPPTNSVQATREVLLAKARAVEARGRPDMALQLWQQILLSEPNNEEALAGVARDYKLLGKNDQANLALDQLRQAYPHDPNIARIQGMSSAQPESEQLQRAGALVQQGKPEDAMRIYRELYGDHPPNGPVAIGFYETLYQTPSGKQEAVNGLRDLAQKNPGDPEYAIALGKVLTYDAHTRGEGIRILQAHQQDPEAQAALRQALIWNAANPDTAGLLRQYLKAHPEDTDVARELKQEETTLARMNSGIARTPEERAAFAALNAHRLDEAEKLFSALLEKDPTNGRVAAGMGFLRMQQQNFGAAISYLEQAEADGYKSRNVDSALSNSRFWFTMGEATQAFDNNQFNVAQAKYRQALTMNPRSSDALKGLAGLLVKQQQYAQAAGVYEQLIRVKPGDADGWRGLFLAYARDDENQKALATMARFPAPVKAAVAKDPDYLRTLASIYQAEGRNNEAQHVLAEALALPFPGNGSTLQADTRLQYAGILLEAKRYAEAANLFTQVLNQDPTSTAAWEGLVTAHHNLGLDTVAIDDVQRMPAATYDSALTDPGFLSMLGAIYQQANQFEVAQGFLERAAKLEIANGGHPSVDLELQLAAIDLDRNDPDRAFAIYRQILLATPDNVQAWQGLIGTLQSTNRDGDAIAELAQIPAGARKQLESDIKFVQTEATLYAAVHDIPHALQYMKLVEDHYARLRQQPPADIDVQNAWLLYNTGNDRALYPALMRIGGRGDLTLDQRKMVEDIWANWSVRRSETALDNGNYRRAIDILDAARQAFPDNLAVRKAVAGGYVRVGRAKEALALFKTVPMQDATSGDFQGAVGAALAANDKNQAEIWLRQALDRYPRDPAILALAAQYEQARGNNERAADYYRASLAMMPAVTPVERLAHILVNPDQDTRAHKAVTAADLQRLLNPDDEPFEKTVKLPPSPTYGPDPYNSAPVVVTPQAQPAPRTPVINSPASDVQSLPTNNQSPVIVPIPNGALHAPQIFATPVPVSSGGTGAAQISGGQYAPLPQRGATLGVPDVPIEVNPPHSMASDAYKGLIFSLMAGGRDAEALDELNKIPRDVRDQLEADIEFVQGVASLYVSLGDTARAQAYLKRVENYYLLHRTNAPAGLEIQHAWLLYNMHDGPALYPVLLRLDARTDLTADQHADLNNLWASWAVRRASEAMDRGNLVRGVEILQAASQDFPDNLTVRRAIASAYARVGRASDSVALYKTIPMTDATPGDYQGAISAALAARDFAQAEAWLRQALARYPHDPQVLGLAARFEQARGNTERAADFWRAALAAMPPGSAIKPLQEGIVPLGNYQAPQPGDTKRLLDPRNDPLPTTPEQAPLPSYQPQQTQAPPAGMQPSAPAQNSTWTPPSSNPLPLPSETAPSAPVYVPNGAAPNMAAPGTGQGTTQPQQLPPPVYVPQGAHRANPSNTPVLIEQRSTQDAQLQPATRTTQPGNSASGNDNSQQRYSGRVNLSPSDADVETGISDSAAPANTSSKPPETNLRIESEPMDPQAAQAQAQFADQTDAQLTQGSAAVIHTLPNAPVTPLSTSANTQPGDGQYTMAQYTPSAQEATTGAYSAPKQTAGQPEQQQTPPPTTKHRRRHRKKQNDQTLGNAPIEQNAQPLEAPPQENSQPETNPQQNPTDNGAGLTDQELEQRNLPPLRGPWVRAQRQAPALSPREQAEMQLQAIESGYSGWLGGTTVLNYRSGDPGFSQLAAFESPFEASTPLGYHGRFTIIAKPVFLDSGQANGQATISVQESSVSGSGLAQIPTPIGTKTDTGTSPPPQQNAVGLGGEVQLAFPNFALAAGYTPYGFLVATFTGRMMWHPGNGPFTFIALRDSIKDSELSYAGLRDPAGASLGVKGNIWGGVNASGGQIQYARGDAQSGYYFSIGGQYITGYNVEKNRRIDGNGGAYWRVYAAPEYGTLSIGANFFAMHYANNQNAFTHGMGGYFSPQAYFLGNVPFTWQGHYQTHWHYNVMGAVGVQAFNQDATPLWPLAADSAVEIANNNPFLPDMTSVSANYDLRSQIAYQISPHWFAGTYFAANDTRNYNSASIGFFIRYTFREQPSTVTTPTGIFPWDGLRPFTVP